jgi:hypothetical protein
MFQFTYKLKVAERVKAKCERHPRYNPGRDGRGGIRGCSTCFSLYDLHHARLMLDSAHKDFLRKAIPWTRSHKPRNKPEVNTQRKPTLGGTTVQPEGLQRNPSPLSTCPREAGSRGLFPSPAPLPAGRAS